MLKDSRPWLKPFGLFYGKVMACRNLLYDQGYFESHAVDRPVISVGNLTVGGAGKTPVTMALLQKLKAQGLRPAVISRGYGRRGCVVSAVDLRASDAVSRFGDEPVLIKSHYGDVPVYVGAKRVDVAKLVLRHEKVDVIVADDAFQHRSLRRQLDVVVLDACQSLESLRPLPWGLGREDRQGLKRAQVVVLNKVNLAPVAHLNKWREWFGQELRSSQILIEAAYQAKKIEPLTPGSGEFERVNSWRACAGIARPETFAKLLREELKLSVHGESWFADHHDYSVEDLALIEKSLKPGQGVVITEKDAVKWRSLNSPLLNRTAVAGLQIKWVKNEEALDHALAAVTR
ncbi:MAG: tetraacyldisaccharide 4'-kinase [Bdellovibrionales bacterium]